MYIKFFNDCTLLCQKPPTQVGIILVLKSVKVELMKVTSHVRLAQKKHTGLEFFPVVSSTSLFSSCTIRTMSWEYWIFAASGGYMALLDQFLDRLGSS